MRTPLFTLFSLLAALAPSARSATAAAPPAAVELVGRWRTPDHGGSFLQTASGPVALEFASHVRAPGPGTWVRVLARVDVDGRTRGVHIAERGDVAGAWLERWRLTARARIRALAGPWKGLLEALLLGRREDLPPDLRRACIATGTSHLLALSGLHVALVAAAIARWPGLGRARAPFSFLVVGLFVLLAGSRPSLLRAGLGWLALSVGLSRGRLSRPLHRLGAVALVLAVTAPQLADDLGAQLSFLAVAGLLAALRAVRGGWLAPVGAFLATAPLCVEVFGRVQPWGLLATPLLVPFVATVLVVGLIAVLPGESLAVLDPLTGPVLRSAAASLEQLLLSAAWFLPPPLQPPAFPLPGGLVSLAVVAALLALPARHASRDRIAW